MTDIFTVEISDAAPKEAPDPMTTSQSNRRRQPTLTENCIGKVARTCARRATCRNLHTISNRACKAWSTSNWPWPPWRWRRSSGPKASPAGRGHRGRLKTN